jgi:dihydroflavonol-4-reductase
VAAMRALVLGGSGHVGNAVVRALLARGWEVTAARRGRTAATNLAGLGVRDALGDAGDAATLDRWIAGCDLVVDAAAPYPLTLAERGAAAASARRAHDLVDAIARHRARAVHVGSFVTRLATAAPHPYFAAKRAGEAVLAAAARAGAPITVVHPTTCMGPGDSRPAAMCLIPRLLAGQMPVVPSHLINVVDVRDVARGVVAAADAAAGEPVVLSGHDVGIPELCALIGDLAGVRVVTRAIPAAAALAAAWSLELGSLGSLGSLESLGSPGSPGSRGAAMPPVLLPTLLALRQTALPVGAVQRALGAAPRPLSATLRDAIAWYRDS